ncbi:MAG: TetR/AcrR family transcriptional regulator [Oscillospiraceae bacterium]|nr:TetR/AcrR family transcriptional regulator [Oscillospiraceae bacterium]
MRVIKESKERKNEILDIAEHLFNEKGYAKTTIDDILKESGIAKGTLYYHFKSKEDILSAMIERQIERRKQSIRQIAEDKTISAAEKLFQVITLLSKSGTLADGLHEKENSELHQKSFTRSLMLFAPIVTDIIEQGIKSGEFSTPYPRESVELLFCASQLHDPGVFVWTKEERRRKVEAFFWILELTLGISDDAKAELYRLAGISKEVSENNG